MNNPLILLFFYIGQEFALHDPVKLCFLIYKMDHSQIDIIRLKPGEKILKGLFHFIKFPGPHILAILPGRTKMPLDDPVFPPSCQCLSNI